MVEQNKKYLFTIEWKNGSINDNIIHWLKEHNINFHYNRFQKLVADVLGIGLYTSFDYEQIEGDMFGIIAE